MVDVRLVIDDVAQGPARFDLLLPHGRRGRHYRGIDHDDSVARLDETVAAAPPGLALGIHPARHSSSSLETSRKLPAQSIDGVYFPTASHGLVKGDQVSRNTLPALGERTLVRIKLALGGEHVEELRLPFFVEAQGEVDRLAVGDDRVVKGCPMLLLLGESNQGILHVLEGPEHGLLIGDEGLVAKGLLAVYVGDRGAALEE